MRNFKEHFVFESIREMQERQIPLFDNIYRPGSDKYFQFFRETRELWAAGRIIFNSVNEDILNTDIGEISEYNGYQVPLDWPMAQTIEEWYNALNEKEEPELNKPKRGGSKKFYVYVRDPETKNIKKVSFGDTTGLKVKLNDPEARKSFAARHKCDTRNDKTKPSYWSCRLPRFAKSLGMQIDNPNGWW